MRTWVPTQKPADALWRYAGLPANRGMRLVEYLNQGLPVSVLDNIHETAEIVERIRPVYNFKAPE